MEADLNPSPLDPAGGGGARVSGGAAPAVRKVTPADLKKGIGSSAFAFRGYDVTNMGRSRELLEHDRYGPVVSRLLKQGSEIAADVLKEPIDLAAHVLAGEKTALQTFPQDIATIVAMEAAQLELLKQFFDVPVQGVRLSFGYSIGELTALINSGVFTLEQLLPIPLNLARDCAELARDTALGVLFTRGPDELEREDVERLCLAISGEGKGLIGPSAYLSPNTALLLGQGQTLKRVADLMREYLPEKVNLKRNPNKWPPLHSPLVWQKLIPNRTAVALYHIEGSPRTPSPPVVSCVTGEASYDGVNTREILVRWTDHPQRLWDVIDTTLAENVETIIHVGPSPSLIAATFARISNNVSRHLGYSNKYLYMLGCGIATELNRHTWLSRLLPSKTSLLRTPCLAHVNLEDWLLEQPVARPTAVSLATIGDGLSGESVRVAPPDRV